jgi:hypothetical protein
LIDELLASEAIAAVPTGVRMPGMNAVIERWAKTLHAELLESTLIWDQAHLRLALREYERHYNEHRTRRSLAGANPSMSDPAARVWSHRTLTIDRQDRLGGVICEYRHAA